VTLDELRRLREANPEAYESKVPKVRVNNDRPSKTGVWQNGAPPPGYYVEPVKDTE
jgi:hypothetical protein